MAVNGLVAPRAASLVDEESPISLTEAGPSWAGRGGVKLAAALECFRVDPAGKRCLDVGASTGGFTDVLLTRGAAAVSAVDVGYGQLDWRLRSDPRTTVHDRTNFRTADPEGLGAPFDLITADVSFISLALLAGKLAACGRPGTEYVVLVKPQFEVGRQRVSRGGVVTDPALQGAVVRAVADALGAAGVVPIGVCPSPITGASGNREFFLHAVKGPGEALAEWAITEAVRP